MLILDTNVLSELMKQKPIQAVLDWFDQQEAQALTITSITEAELWYGLNAMTPGRRQKELERVVVEMLREDFADAVLPFDSPAAEAYGVLASRLRKVGTPIGQSDTMIAAITLIREATLVTRNVRHFQDCGIHLINPFEASAVGS